MSINTLHHECSIVLTLQHFIEMYGLAENNIHKILLWQWLSRQNIPTEMDCSPVYRPKWYVNEDFLYSLNPYIRRNLSFIAFKNRNNLKYS